MSRPQGCDVTLPGW